MQDYSPSYTSTNIGSLVQCLVDEPLSDKEYLQ